MLTLKGKSGWRSLNLRSLMRWFRCLCVLLIFFVITTTNWFYFKAMKENSKDTAERTESQISQYIKSVWNLGEAIAAAPITKDNSLSLRQRAQMLIPYADAYDLYMIGITDQKGLLGSTLDRAQITSKEMLNDEGVGDLSSRPAFQEMMATGKSILTDTYLAGADGTTQINTIWIPYYDEETIAGAVTVSIKFAYIRDIITSTSLEDKYYFSLIDSQNKISANPDPEIMGNKLEEAYRKGIWTSISFKELDQNLTEGKWGEYWGVNNNRLEYINYMPVEGTQWTLVIRTDFFGSFKDTFISLIIKLGVYLALIILFSLKKNRDIVTREHLFNMMTNNVDEVFLAYNMDKKRLEYVSSNAMRIFGVSAEKWLADPRQAVPDIDSLFADLGDAQGEGFCQIDRELHDSKTGKDRPFRFRIYKFMEDEIRWAILVITDETAEQKKSQLLKDALASAEQASRAKSAFLTSMSHDIRTPMNAIVGMSAIAISNLNDREKVAECLKKVTLSSQHLLNLINNVLDMSMSENGKLKLKHECFDLSLRLKELNEIFRVQAASAQIQLYMETMKISHPVVYGDEQRLSQIFVNLVTNALKFTKPGGMVRIAAEELPSEKEGIGQYCFTVYDNGIGIETKFLKQLFEPFERVESSTISKTKGSGLGLAIVKRLVTLMDGTIDVESELGKGSTFTVLLPLPWGEAPAEANPSAVQEEKPLKKHRILLVEDNELNMEIARELLTMAMVEVEIAWNGAEAVEKFKNSPEFYYDMIMTDIQMPVMDGYEEARAIRSIQRADAISVPIIAMTADASPGARQQAVISRMSGYITKPLEVPQLMKTLEEWLDS